MKQTKFVPAGAVLLDQGEAGNTAYMIESGKIEISMKGPDGDELKLTELGPGTMVGEMAVMRNGRRSAKARALEDTVLSIIPGGELRESARLSGSMYNYLMDLIAKRTQDAQIKLLKRQEEKILSTE